MALGIGRPLSSNDLIYRSAWIAAVIEYVGAVIGDSYVVFTAMAIALIFAFFGVVRAVVELGRALYA
jgi:hypothetical protein